MRIPSSVIVSLLLVLSTQAHALTTIGLPNTSSTQGSTITVSAPVSDFNTIAGIELHIQFDSTVLIFQSASYSTLDGALENLS